LTQADSSSYVIETSGAHAASFTTLKKTNIHSVWIRRIDELLECGVMPAKIMIVLQKEATETTRPLMPTLIQIHKRKKKVFKSTANLSSQHALTTYMRKRMVIVMYLLYTYIMHSSYDDFAILIRSILTTWMLTGYTSFPIVKRCWFSSSSLKPQRMDQKLPFRKDGCFRRSLSC
jgi:hypothetical protein